MKKEKIMLGDYFNLYELNDVMSIHNFIQEMIVDGVDINDYPEIKIYYDIICKNSVKQEPNFITVDYAVKKLKNIFIKYGFAHYANGYKSKLFYYWRYKN